MAHTVLLKDLRKKEWQNRYSCLRTTSQIINVEPTAVQWLQMWPVTSKESKNCRHLAQYAQDIVVPQKDKNGQAEVGGAVKIVTGDYVNRGSMVDG